MGNRLRYSFSASGGSDPGWNAMKSIRPLLLAGFLFASASAFAGGPNILLILADDLGWSDLGCYGNELFETPHLDRFAAEGTRFTQAYAAAPICSASRAALLTGKTPARLGFEFVTKNEPGYQPNMTPLRAPPFTLNLDLAETTFPDIQARSGRPSAFFGKWHLNQHYQRYLGWSPTHGPKAHGFVTAEEDFGSHPYSYWGNRKERTFLELPDGVFPEDTLTDRAIDFLTNPGGESFFCMLSHFYVHDPVHTRAKWLYEHYLEKIPDNQPAKEVLAKYGAMVTTLDHQVGRVLQALDDSGTSALVVFTSDNGGHPNYAGNAPLRGSKWNLYEGGIRVPFITRFEKRKEGKTCDVPVSLIDLFPTFAEYREFPVPESVEGTSLLPLIHDFPRPISPRPLYWHFPYYHPEKGYDEAPPEIGINDGYTSQTRPHSAIRKGDWKLLRFYEDDRIELYHLGEDPFEENDRSGTDPEIADTLQKELASLLEKSNARFPTPHPDYQP